jgi:flagellar hook assembly protein FlgD
VTVNTELGKMLVEGLATLYYIGEHPDREDIQALLEPIIKVPEVGLKNHFQLCVIVMHVICVQQHTSQLMANPSSIEAVSHLFTSLLPILNVQNALHELQVLHLISRLLASRQRDPVLVQELKTFVSTSLKESSRTMLDLVPYQRLVWIVDEVARVQEDSDLAHEDGTNKVVGEVKKLMYEAYMIWMKRLWNQDLITEPEEAEAEQEGLVEVRPYIELSEFTKFELQGSKTWSGSSVSRRV